MEIRDLDRQQGCLESLNDVKAKNLLGGQGGTTILLLTSGAVAVFDNTGAQIDASNLSFASITADISGNTTVRGGTSLNATVKRPRVR